MKIQILANTHETYNGNVLYHVEEWANFGYLDCKGADMKLIRVFENSYSVKFDGGSVCNGKGKFEYIDQTLRGVITFKGQKTRTKLNLTKSNQRLGREI